MITPFLTLNILSSNFYLFLKAPISFPTFSEDFKIPLTVFIFTSILEHFNVYVIYPPLNSYTLTSFNSVTFIFIP